MKKGEEEKKVCKKCGIENCKCGCNGDETKCVCSEACTGDENCKCGDSCECVDNCKYDDKDKQIADLNEQLKRTMADFINYKRRNEEIYKVATISGIGTAVMAILPCIDAIESAEKMYEDKTIKKGLKDILENFEKAFSGFKVEKIKTAGEEFNPELHNAVLSEEKKGVKPGIILEEFQAGYIMGDKVIRHSVVKVSK